LEEACARLAHRGPDGHGIFMDDMAGLVHARLAIIDLSPMGAQPMTDPASGVTVVFNGEIYNFRQLKDQLPGVAWRGHSDTEVILNLYLAVGVAVFERLRGMFAIAIWDPRSRQLHLARDRFGIKPLLIQTEGRVLRFGSEVKAILALGADKALNLSVVRDYLEQGRQNHGPATFFRGIHSLAPGHFVTWSDGALSEPRRYWAPDAGPALPLHDPQAVEEIVWEAFLDSLEAHLVADVPVGVSLSSGLDSQLVTRGLAELRRRGRAAGEVHTFTFGFREGDYDEIRRVDQVDYGLPLVRHARRVLPEDCVPALRRAIRTFESPLGGLGSVASYLMMELARSKGITVLLSGEGSDESFGGYRYYHYARLRELAEAGDPAALAQELEGWAKVSGERLVPGTPAFDAKLFPVATDMRAPDGTSLSGNAFLGRALLESPPASPHPSPLGDGHVRTAMLRDLTSDKLPKLLWFQDRSAMSHGVETRVPFLDHVLFATAAALPSDWLIRDGVAKYALKRVLLRYCGIDAFGPTKHYVATPQREWIKSDIRAPIMDWLDNGLLARSGLVDYPAFRQAYADYAAQADLGNSFFVWKMMDLEALLEEFFPHGI
jgi:asparagine synthase (glutamine-hydrolysing)